MTAIAFFCYLSLIACIAVRAVRATHNVDDYLIGGRKVGGAMAGLSAGASDMSGWLLLGLPGLAVAAPVEALWVGAGLALGTWINWRFVARKLREETGRYGVLTIPSFFRRRFKTHGGAVQALTAASILVFFTLYAAAGFVAGGKLFSSVFDLSYSSAVVIGAVLILVYTLWGGFLAVVWTDALQATMMIGALAIVTLCAVIDGPPTATIPIVIDGDFDSLAIASALAWGLGYMGQPHIVTRFMAMTSPDAAAHGQRIGVTWTTACLALAIAVGIFAGPILGPQADPERVFILAIEQYLPPLLAGICLAAVLAAIMSTADSQLLITASALAEDLLPYDPSAIDSSRRLRNGRIAVFVICCAALTFALNPAAGVFSLVAFAWAGFGATVGPALLIALHGSTNSGAGSLGGIATGLVVVTCWDWLPNDGWGIYELLPGFIAALLVNIGVSRFVP